MPQANISDLCHHLWSEHTQQITNHITKSSISQLQSTFDGAIFHCEDKHASSLRIYCPCLYYQSIESTFQDPSIFEQLPDEPSSIVSSLVESLHRQHGKAYPWAVGSGRQLPSGYILAKRKKEFRSGRPIISFVESPFRPMLNILARLIFQLIPTACPNHFATGDVYTLLSILREAPVDADLILVNQELAGFFTSIDQDRFVRSWFMLLDFLRPKMNVSDDEAFSVYPGKSNNPDDIIKGRTFRRLNVTRKIVIKHVPELIKSALNMQTFALGKRCVRQSRGSPMGSPLSPALCLMVVSISEQIWSSTFHQILSNHHLFIRHIRYVDNRLIFGDKRLTALAPYEVLLDEGFYGKPIILETAQLLMLGHPSYLQNQVIIHPTMDTRLQTRPHPSQLLPADHQTPILPRLQMELAETRRQLHAYYFVEVQTPQADNSQPALRRLMVTEVDRRGVHRNRQPEFFFNGIIGHIRAGRNGWIDSWDQSTQLANYWRRYFQIPEIPPDGNWHPYHHEAQESPVSVQGSGMDDSDSIAANVDITPPPVQIQQLATFFWNILNNDRDANMAILERLEDPDDDLTRHPVQIFSAADLAHLASHLAESTRTLSDQALRMEALSDISD